MLKRCIVILLLFLSAKIAYSQFNILSVSRSLIRQGDTFTVVADEMPLQFFIRKGCYDQYAVLTEVSHTTIGSNHVYTLRMPLTYNDGTRIDDRVHILRAVSQAMSPSSNLNGFSNFFLLRVFRTSATRVLGWGRDTTLFGQSTDSFTTLAGAVDIAGDLWQGFALPQFRKCFFKSSLNPLK